MSGIDPAFVDAVLVQLGGEAPMPYHALQCRLRAAFPGRQITVCSEDEVSPRLNPVGESSAAAIYLVAAGEHCVSLTNDAATACGIVVALKSDDA